MVGYAKISSKASRVGSGVQCEINMIKESKVNKTFWIKFLLVILHSVPENIIFQHYSQSYCDYLLKMGCMDEEHAKRLQKVKFHSIKDLQEFHNNNG